MSSRVPGTFLNRFLALRVRPLGVVCALFVIIAIGTMMINSVNRDTAELEVKVIELRNARDEMLRLRDSLDYEVQVSDTDDYIIAKARQLYNYMMPGELLFVVKNPEALYGNGEAVQMYVVEELE